MAKSPALRRDKTATTVKEPRGQINEDGIFEPGSGQGKPKGKQQPAYRIYAESKIVVSKALGPYWQKKHDGAVAANSKVWEAWEEVFRYFNNNQTKTLQGTPRGTFKRGDSTENVLFSNINLMVPATYSKNPDFAINTTDDADQDFIKALKPLLNTVFKRRDLMNAKPKLRKATGMGLLTNAGVFKVDYTRKDDSIDGVMTELENISASLQKAKDGKELEELYGKLMALEAQAEVSEKSGAKMRNILPHHLLVDPFAEDSDGCDGRWMVETQYLPTEYLKARFAVKDEDGEYALAYAPTHKASFDSAAGSREDGIGLVLQKLNATSNEPTSHSDEERLSYLYTYMTEVKLVWDKTTHRVFLFLANDWKWPLWVWDDPLKLSRFFPYFIIQFAFTTGGTTSVGETSYYLDQQDEINDINRQAARIRRTVFDFFFYDSDAINPEDAEAVIKALRGVTESAKHSLGVRLGGEKKLSDLFQAILPPSADYAQLFNKDAPLNVINRTTNTSDALRGVQFKTNTNEAAVQTYQDAVKLSVGAKIDTVEDVCSEAGHAVAEMLVQFMQIDEVAGLIGQKLAQGWRNMSVEEFNSNYSCEVVAGSTEKANSTFRKKEAIQVAQAIGQVGQSAPVTTMMLMIRMFQEAFGIVVTDEDWQMLLKEGEANLQKGLSVQGAAGAGAAGGEGGGQDQGQGDIEAMRNAPPEVKARVVQMQQAGKSKEEILAYLKQNVGQGGGSNGAQPKAGRTPPRRQNMRTQANA